MIKYLIYFIVFLLIIYLLYYFLVVNSQIRIEKGKSKKKKKNLPAELLLLRDYYKIDIEKIGVIRILRILNFINALVLSLLTLLVVRVEEVYLKIGILVVLILPTIWFVYYFIAKYLKYLERREN